MDIRTFDCDGVVFINKAIGGLRPEPNDVIITGRSYEEIPETVKMLEKRCIYNQVFYNPLKFEQKTRESSGVHKAGTIKWLEKQGYNVLCHFEDDEVQAAVIRKECPDVPIIMIMHDLTEKENVRNLDF